MSAFLWSQSYGPGISRCSTRNERGREKGNIRKVRKRESSGTKNIEIKIRFVNKIATIICDFKIRSI